MSQIDEIIKNYIGIMPCVGCEELKEDDLKRFASEVCKAMLADICLDPDKDFTCCGNYSSGSKCKNNECGCELHLFSKQIKERAERWINPQK